MGPTFDLIILGVVGPPEALAKPKVRQLDVAVDVDEDVVRLDVPVDKAHLVHAFDGAHELGCVEPAIIWPKFVL